MLLLIFIYHVLLCYHSINILRDSIDKHHLHSNQGAYMLVAIFVHDDTPKNWKYGHIPPYGYFSSYCFSNSIFLCVLQDQFCAQSTSRMAFHQEGEDDEDMTPIHMTMNSKCHDKGVQKGCPSIEGGPRII